MSAMDGFTPRNRDMTYADAFVDNVRRYLEANGLSLRQVARQSRVSPQTLSGVLIGDNGPTLATMERVSAGIGITLPALLLPGLDVSGKTPKAIVELMTLYMACSTKQREMVMDLATMLAGNPSD